MSHVIISHAIQIRVASCQRLASSLSVSCHPSKIQRLFFKGSETLRRTLTTMQMQRAIVNTETQTISNKQSLECVQMLLKAGVGCIAYLRGLLPAENFGEYRLSSKNNGRASSSSGSFSSDGTTELNISGVTIMTLNRGFTNEGDRIIDYLENGIFEAIDKQYLRKVIFGIYLDSNDPNNIVEAYTFNFHYHKLPGSCTAIPIMTLGDQLSKMSLARPDPISETLKKGQIPTLGEVKRSVKAMMKSLITTINQMENLPKNRYGNFKLFFNEDAPDDYQPPHFQAADAEANKWFLTTHATGEIPERTSIGQVNAGWHGLDMKVVSVSSYLPSISEDNNAPFAGITSHTAPKLTPVEEARIRVEDAQLQKKDALERNIVWSVDEDEDAEGEMVIDEGIVLSRFGGDIVMAPVGIRSEDGGVQPFSQVNVTSSRAHAQYGGMSESTPIRVGDLNIRKAAHDIEETQQIPPTQEIVMGSPIPAPSSNKTPSLPASDVASSASAISTQEVDTQCLQDLLGMGNGVSTADSEMLDMETQVLEVPGPSCNSGITGPQIPRRNKRSKGSERLIDETQLDCDCGISIDDASLLCEGGCNRWFHVWCMGYHSARDKRLPSQFMCFDCRLRGSHEWDIITGKIHADMIARYKDLALFRRAIKIYEVYQPSSALLFREHTGCDTALVGQLLTRLEEEGFIAVESIVSDELGIGVTRSYAKKGKKGVKTKKQKELQKTKYVFLSKAKRSKAYADYFNPLTEVENRLMGLSDTARCKSKAGTNLSGVGSSLSHAT
ncbi:HORMA domain-containing protein [Suillus subaureus]|uniref:HORMA domain-containing protein n=1 Tax=Suillus subaureus TaxID=48587 RepID=A0A9P7EPT2_9AGAM|nr:HORMA domain-containing protein [Suillus subaureus]KAG1827598.1 HORMA domain-containing protein [Suillus subaureus]